MRFLSHAPPCKWPEGKESDFILLVSSSTLNMVIENIVDTRYLLNLIKIFGYEFSFNNHFGDCTLIPGHRLILIILVR